MASPSPPLPGLLCVSKSLKRSLSVQECDNWYNNEHVPLRMRLPFFLNGFRYRALSSETWGSSAANAPEWLAIYDISDMWELKKNKYKELLFPSIQSLRDNETIAKLTANVKYFDIVSTDAAPDFISLEQLAQSGKAAEEEGSVLVIVSVTLKRDKGPQAERQWDSWYENHHLPALAKVPGWRRTRRYRTSAVEDKAIEAENIEYVTLNEFAKKNGIGGPDHQAAIDTQRKTDIVDTKWRQSYELYYIQSLAPRDLKALNYGTVEEFVSPDGVTRTLSGPKPVIESCITTRNGIKLPYRLEGATGRNAPLVILCTSVLLSWDIWGSFVDCLGSSSNNPYRIVRFFLTDYDNLTTTSPEMLATSIVLAKDILALLDALRAPKTVALIGARLGGPTAANISTSQAYPYVLFNSTLKAACDDGVILGASTMRQLKKTLKVLEDGGADQSVSERIQSVCKYVKEASRQ